MRLREYVYNTVNSDISDSLVYGYNYAVNKTLPPAKLLRPLCKCTITHDQNTYEMRTLK